MNIFKVLKELNISFYEYDAMPYWMSDSQKISTILIFKAIKKARAKKR